MSILERVRNAWRALRGGEERSIKYGDLGGDTVARSAAGVAVTEKTAMLVSVFHACIRVLAETLAMTPCEMRQRLDGGGSADAFDHPLHEILSLQANPEMTAYTFWETHMVQILNAGNGIAYKQMNGAGRLTELWPLRPDRVIPFRHEGRLLYTVFLPNSSNAGWNSDLDAWPWWETHAVLTFPSEFIFHTRNLGDEGIVGKPMISRLRNTLGLAIAAESYGSALFTNAARPSGVIEVPGTLNDVAYDRLKESFDQAYTGLKNAHKSMLLEQNAKFKEISFTADEAQFIQTRKLQGEEIVRPFRIPPHMVGILDGSSYATAEQLAIEFVTFTMTPWFTRLEQEISRQLLTNADRRAGYYARFDADQMVRGDRKTRYGAHNAALNGGFKSVNEIRRKEGDNPIPNGDIYRQPVNMVPAGTQIVKPGPEAAPAAPEPAAPKAPPEPAPADPPKEPAPPQE